MLHEQADDLGRALAVDRPQQRALDLAACVVLEQQPDLRGILGVERVRQRVGPLHARARVEQQPQAAVVGGLGRVVDGLVVVRVRARLEQQRGHARLVGDARRAVERAERAELRVLPARVRVGAGVEQRPRAVEQPVGALAAEEGGVRDVEQRQPLARAGRPGRRPRIARERRPHPLGLAEHERRVEPLAAEVGVEREQRLGVVAAAVGRLLHQPARAVLARHRLRLRAAHEPRPARLAELARDRELRVGELERLPARPRVLHAPLRLAPRALEIDPSCVHHRSPPCRPRSAAAGRGRSEHVDSGEIEVGLGPCPRTRVRPRALRGRYPAAGGLASGCEPWSDLLHRVCAFRPGRR